MYRSESVLRRSGEIVADRATRIAGCLGNKAFSHIYVTGYPKSGSTWLSDMISDYCQLPFPQHYLAPLLFDAVVQNHWVSTPNSHKTVYIVRDGRDVAISAYFDAVRRLSRSRNGRRVVERSYRCFRGLSIEEAKECRKYLPGFLRDWSNEAIGAQIGWESHVRRWLNNDGLDYCVKYEDLLENTTREIGRVIRALGYDIRDDELKWSVKKYRFERQTGRARGEEDSNSFRRKGVAGDWRNYFTSEAAAIFEKNCGEALRLAGYVKGRDWYH